MTKYSNLYLPLLYRSVYKAASEIISSGQKADVQSIAMHLCPEMATSASFRRRIHRAISGLIVTGDVTTIAAKSKKNKLKIEIIQVHE